MRILINIFLSLKSQINQIREGGFFVLLSKVKRMVKLLFMRIVAPAAVYSRIDWPEAYDFWVYRIIKMVKKLRRQWPIDRVSIDRLMKEAGAYLEKNTQRIPDLKSLPDWTQRSVLLGNLYNMKNEVEKSMSVYQRISEVQSELFKRHQLNDLVFEFIPRSLPSGSIGVYEYLEMYIKARILDSLPNKKMILLLPKDARVNNPCYLRYWSKYITIISDPLLIKMFTHLEDLLTMPCISFVNFHGEVYKSALVQGIIREQWTQEKRPAFFTLSREDSQRGWDCLKSLGLSKDAWFITLHVREPGWRDGSCREEDFRNCDISTYIPAIKAVTAAGGWVFRIGDPGMTKLPPMPRVIDYAHSPIKSDWMDIFLCAQCRFMIGTSSGMCAVASSFGVPLVMTNILPGYGVYHFTSQDLFIPRLCFSKHKKRYLTFGELMSPPVGTATAQSHFDNMDIQVIENKAEEIKALVEEMLEKCAGILRYSEEDEILQERFREITVDCGKTYGDLNLVSHTRIGKHFLRKHANILSSDIMEKCVS